MTLDARVVGRRGDLDLDVCLQVDHGVVALVGPNGAGKSSVVRALAGLLRHGGRVAVDGVTYDDAETGIHLPPHRRSVSVVLQVPLLLPHLSVLDNVAFGPRSRGERGARKAAAERLERLGVGALASRRPATLSGGQAQRVALARGLVGDPALLLLDEPLTALDVTTRAEVRRDVAVQLAERGGVTVLVTHDPVDALTLAGRVLVVEGGRVVQDGSPAELVRSPRSPYVARLVGLNLLRGHTDPADPSVVLTDSGVRVHTTTRASGPVLVTFPPSAVALHPAEPAGSPRNVWPVTVSGLDLLGEVARVALGGPLELTADVTAAAVADLGLAPGARVWAAVKATEISVTPA